MAWTPHLVCAALVLSIAGSGCGAADSTPSGAGGGDAGQEQPWLHIQPTWTSIYDGYFGPAGVGSCTGGSTCHSTGTMSGAIASNFTCPDKDTCFTSLTGTSNLVRTQDVADPTSAPLLKKLRTPGGPGKMPSDSTFTFQPEDFAVLEKWIAAGAQND